jgi:hypothetical protein
MFENLHIIIFIMKRRYKYTALLEVALSEAIHAVLHGLLLYIKYLAAVPNPMSVSVSMSMYCQFPFPFP